MTCTPCHRPSLNHKRLSKRRACTDVSYHYESHGRIIISPCGQANLQSDAPGQRKSEQGGVSEEFEMGLSSTVAVNEWENESICGWR